MSEKSSARVSTQEDDLVQRSTKKVKTRGEVDLNQPSENMEIIQHEDNTASPAKGSYKDTLLTSLGLEEDQTTSLDMDDDDPNPEDKWYRNDDDRENDEKPFNPCPTIPVSKEEFEEWCKPWKNALMVKVLGKRVTFAFMEQRLHRDWEKKGEMPADSAADENGRIADPHHHRNLSNEKSNPDFGPWMLVKKYNNRKKSQIGQKYPHANQDATTFYNTDEGISPRGQNSNSGSRFAILQEENPGSAQGNVNEVEVGQETISKNGPQLTFSQGVAGKTQMPKKIIRPGASKNPQTQKKPTPSPKSLIEPSRKENNGKIKPRTPGLSTSNPKGSEIAMKAAKRKEKNPDLEGMEMVVNEYMKRMETDKWEAFEALKGNRTTLEGHWVRENLLFNPDKQQGVGSKAFPYLIRDLRYEYGANMFFLLETHVSGARGNQIRGKIGFDKSFVVDAVGHAGGIWCLWDSSAWSVDVLEHDKQFVHLKVSSNNSNPWLITAVYGSPQRATRRTLWQSLKSYAANECVAACGLIDLGFAGWPYTWKRGNLAERLDRGQWDMDKLQRMLPEEITKKIVAISPPSPWKEANHLAWGPSSDGSFITNTDLNEWLFQNLMANNSWNCLFGVAMSSIWYLRNKLVFNGESVHVTTAVNQIRARSEEFFRIVGSNLKPHNIKAAGVSLISWSRPEEGCVKVNVDGSWFGHTNNTACGGVFRDSNGRFLKGFSCNLGNCSIMHAELWAVIHGLNIATTNGYQNLIVESDSAEAINFINRGCRPTPPCAPLIQDIRVLTARIQKIAWLHSLREANSVADLFAKKGQELPVGLHMIDQAPLLLVLLFSVTVSRPSG
ncbi:hypothetical protein Ahy_B08g092237 [Arachis hypogaea]|uniref:RNase H type-1 domain-containing protein n=1 Tax=Arachis hypogaea TaxID=3818 RepID=A0A444Y3L5_ARAHY|nr:hypothetical protein Ahy_B08g092237 [Arachis hypogaea]